MPNVRIRGKIPREEWPKIVARFQSGETLTEIGRSYHCTAPAIRYIVSRVSIRGSSSRQPRTGGPRGSATPKIVPTSAEAEAVSRRTPRRGTFGTASTLTSQPSWPRWIHFLPTIAITTTKPCWRRPIVCYGRAPARAWSWSAYSATGKKEQLPSAAFRVDGASCRHRQ